MRPIDLLRLRAPEYLPTREDLDALLEAYDDALGAEENAATALSDALERTDDLESQLDDIREIIGRMAETEPEDMPALIGELATAATESPALSTGR